MSTPYVFKISPGSKVFIDGSDNMPGREEDAVQVLCQSANDSRSDILRPKGNSEIWTIIPTDGSSELLFKLSASSLIRQFKYP